MGVGLVASGREALSCGGLSLTVSRSSCSYFSWVAFVALALTLATRSWSYRDLSVLRLGQEELRLLRGASFWGDLAHL